MDGSQIIKLNKYVKIRIILHKKGCINEQNYYQVAFLHFNLDTNKNVYIFKLEHYILSKQAFLFHFLKNVDMWQLPHVTRTLLYIMIYFMVIEFNYMGYSSTTAWFMWTSVLQIKSNLSAVSNRISYIT